MSEGRRHWRRWLLIVGGMLLLPVAGATAFVFWPRTPTAITEQQAIDQFRGETPSVGESLGSGPVPGVYTYDVDGTEQIKMGPLPLPERDIPDTVTGVVRPVGECFTFDLNLMAEHTESTWLCPGPDGSLSMPQQTKAEKVPGFDVNIRNECAPSTLLSPTEAELPLTCTEVFDVSGLVLTIHLEGTARSEPGGDVEVGGTTVATTRLVISFDATGDLSGTQVEEWWLTPEHLPVRMTRTIRLTGPGQFEETSTLVLRGLQPRT